LAGRVAAALTAARARQGERRHAKLVCYAPWALRWPAAPVEGRRRLGPLAISDRPHPGAVIRRGAPVCTLQSALEEARRDETRAAAAEAIVRFLTECRIADREAVGEASS
jgi:hypothetical protein